MRISVLTVNFFSGRFTELLAHSLFKLNLDADIELNIFDNGSTDLSLDFVNNFRHGKINVMAEPCPFPVGSSSHGFAVDYLLRHCVLEKADAVCLIDSDCFSFTQGWLSDYSVDIVNGNTDIIAAQAFCPTVEEKNRYMWPGFTLYHPDQVGFLLENDMSFIPQARINQVNDSGQIVSLELEKVGSRVRYLPRTAPNQVGKMTLEKWSIDSKINHFFAASMAAGVKNPLAYVYGDKTRGRYIAKLYKAWRLFQQLEVKKLLST